MATGFITGAASLMGEGIAHALAAHGWDLVLTDIDESRLQSGADELPQGYHLETARLDVADRAQVRAVVQDVAARRGSIDALVNCAGGLRGVGLKPKPPPGPPPAGRRRARAV